MEPPLIWTGPGGEYRRQPDPNRLFFAVVTVIVLSALAVGASIVLDLKAARATETPATETQP